MDEQYFIAAAMRYEELRGSGQATTIDAFVVSEPAATRDELRAFLEFGLAIGSLDEPTPLTPAQIARTDAVLTRARVAFEQERTALVRNLTQHRQAHKLTVGKLARQLRLPIDVLARLERGKIDSATIPQRLVQRLADVFGEHVVAIQAALQAAPQLSSARLSAADGTKAADEPVVSFAQALAEAAPSHEERAEWNGA